MEDNTIFNAEAFISSSQKNSIELFEDTASKMKAASEHLVKDFFKFRSSKFAEELEQTDKSKYVAYNYSFFTNITTALKAEMMDDDIYGKGLCAVASIMSHFPEYKDVTIPAVSPFIKRAYRKLETTDSKGQEFIAVGIMKLASSIADLEPSMTKEALKVLRDPKIIEGLGIDSKPHDKDFSWHFSEACLFLAEMLRKDNSLLKEIKEVSKPFMVPKEQVSSKSGYEITGFAYLRDKIAEVEKKNAIILSANVHKK